MLVSKSDLLEVLGDFDPANAERHLRQLANAAPVIPLSARSGDGIQTWIDWLIDARLTVSGRVAAGDLVRPAVQPEGALLHTASPPDR